MTKSGMTEAEALEMMEKETWLTAEQAKERGLIDAVMFEEKEEELFVAGPLFALPSKEKMEQTKRMLEEAEKPKAGNSAILMQMQLELLNLKGAN